MKKKRKQQQQKRKENVFSAESQEKDRAEEEAGERGGEDVPQDVAADAAAGEDGEEVRVPGRFADPNDLNRFASARPGDPIAANVSRRGGGTEEEEVAGERRPGSTKNEWGSSKNAKNIDLFASRWIGPDAELRHMREQKRRERGLTSTASRSRSPTRPGRGKGGELTVQEENKRRVAQVIRRVKDRLGKDRLKTKAQDVGMIVEEAADDLVAGGVEGGSQDNFETQWVDAAVEALLAREAESDRKELEGKQRQRTTLDEAGRAGGKVGSKRRPAGSRVAPKRKNLETEVPAMGEPAEKRGRASKGEKRKNAFVVGNRTKRVRKQRADADNDYLYF